jgi:hypothetical protein
VRNIPKVNIDIPVERAISQCAELQPLMPRLFKRSVPSLAPLCPFARLFVFTFAVLLMSSCSVIPQSIQKVMTGGDGLTTPTREREVLIRNEQNDHIEPWAMERATGGGYILAGSAGERGWAAKTDANGKVLWNYYTSLREQKVSIPGQGYSPVGVPEYRGAVSMPDGSVFLCGHIPRSTRSGKPDGLITHLDSNGHLLKEDLIAPEERSIYTFEGCVRWRGGVAIIGSGMHFLPPANAQSGPTTESYYWLVFLDSSGKIRWKKVIMSSFLSFGPSTGSIVLLAHESELIFSASDNKDSEVIKVNSNGELLARKQIHGQYRLVHSIEPSKLLQIWGTESNKPISTLINLNEHLDELQKIEGAPRGDFFSSAIYRMPDQSFLLFGEVMPTSSYGRAGIAHVDSNLNAESTFEPLPANGPFNRSALMNAVTPSVDAKKFAVAMSVAVSGKNVPASEKYGSLADFFRGVNLTFVRLR